MTTPKPEPTAEDLREEYWATDGPRRNVTAWDWCFRHRAEALEKGRELGRQEGAADEREAQRGYLETARLQRDDSDRKLAEQAARLEELKQLLEKIRCALGAVTTPDERLPGLVFELRGDAGTTIAEQAALIAELERQRGADARHGQAAPADDRGVVAAARNLAGEERRVMVASTNRIRPDAGWCSERQLPRGPNGRALCRWCTTVECAPPRRTFCSDACVHEWKIRTNPGYAKLQVLKRDDCRCAKCGVDTFADKRGDEEKRLAVYPRSLAARKMSTFDMDHIVPVVEGGGECGLENLRTLCHGCHRIETAALAKRRAQARKESSNA